MDLSGNAAVVLNNIVRGQDAADGNLDLDPNFTNPDFLDFTISTNSPAFNSGGGPGVGSEDLNGNARVALGSLDRGCYEAQFCTNPLDLCENAQPITLDDSPRFSSNICATGTGDMAASCYATPQKSVWFKFQIPSTGDAEILLTDIQPLMTNVNFRIAAFAGDCGSQTEVGCSNDAGVNEDESLILANLPPGTVIHVRVDASGGTEGSFQIQINTLDIPPCPADLNGDGFIASADLLELLGEFGCTSGCTADIDQNGEVGTSDILVLLGVFGTPCP